MHPANLEALRVAGRATRQGVAATVANNHVLDWGSEGLLETCDTLDEAGIPRAGAGADEAEAWKPAVLPTTAEDEGGDRVVVVAAAFGAGTPAAWAATATRPGVAALADLSEASVARVRAAVGDRGPGDLVVLSIHWGPNWGWAPDRGHEHFARRCIDAAGVDLVWGHSSHHVKGMEVYKGRVIIYGCGDFVNDYEGIEDLGAADFRGDVGALYVVSMDPATRLVAAVDLVPTKIERLAVNAAGPDDGRWLAATLDREGRRRFNTRATFDPATGRVLLHWAQDPAP